MIEIDLTDTTEEGIKKRDYYFEILDARMKKIVVINGKYDIKEESVGTTVDVAYLKEKFDWEAVYALAKIAKILNVEMEDYSTKDIRKYGEIDLYAATMIREKGIDLSLTLLKAYSRGFVDGMSEMDGINHKFDRYAEF